MTMSYLVTLATQSIDKEGNLKNPCIRDELLFLSCKPAIERIYALIFLLFNLTVEIFLIVLRTTHH